MECGEIDFAHILAKHQGTPLGLNFIRVYWEQMLRAVQAIHEEKIVHSDLKPANFLLVQGQLKLIDFGIAKRMGDDTTNIHRDQQVSPKGPHPRPVDTLAKDMRVRCLTITEFFVQADCEDRHGKLHVPRSHPRHQPRPPKRPGPTSHETR